MTLTTQQYTHMRRVFIPGDDTFEINRTTHAVLWHDTVGVRLLLFVGEHLVWTEWCPTREAAIDAALEQAKWFEEHNYVPLGV